MKRQEAALPQVYTLTAPPSANDLWVPRLIGGKPRISLSDAYKSWKRLAASEITVQRVQAGYPRETVSGPVKVYVEVGEHPRRDLDSYIKGAFDALQAAVVLKNDRQIQAFLASWAAGVRGVRLEIHDWCSLALPGVRAA